MAWDWLTLANVSPVYTFADSPPRPIAQVMYEMEWGTGSINRTTALSVPEVIRARNLICSVSTLPLVQFGPSGGVVPSPLLGQIDPNVANVVTLAQTLEDLLFYSISWWEILAKDRDGYPTSAAHLDHTRLSVDPPDGIPPSPLPSGADPRDSVVYLDGRPILASTVLRFDSPNPPLLTVAGKAIRIAAALQGAAGNYAKNPRPQDFFTPTEGADPFDDPETEIPALLTQWAADRQTGSTAYVPAALKYNAVENVSPAELQLVQLQERAAVAIAIAAGLEPEDVGVSTTSRTYANAVDRRRDRINDTLSPYMAAITGRLSMGDFTRRGYTVGFDLDDYLRANPTERVAYYSGMAALNALGAEEIRTEEKLGPMTPELRKQAAKALEPAPVPDNVTPIRPAAKASAGGAGSHFADDAPHHFADVPVINFAVDTATRTISGRAVPYGTDKVAQKFWRKYRFAADALTWSEVGRVKLLEDHNYSLAFGKAVTLTQTTGGLDVVFRVARGDHGDRMLALAEDGVKDGFSIGVDFEPADTIPDPRNPGVTLVQRATLREVSLTAMPSFDDARVTSVKASQDQPKGPGMDPEETDPAAVPVTFSADQFTAFMTHIGAPQAAQTDPATAEGDGTATFVNPGGPARLEVTEPLPYTFSQESGFRRGPQGYDFSTDLFAAANGDREAKDRAEAWIVAQFDTAKTDVAGLNPSPTRPDLYVDQVDYATPLWDMVYRGSITDSTPFIIPKFSSSSALVGPHTEGVEPSAGAFVATTQTITPTAVSGKAIVNREVKDAGGNPQVSGLIWRQMLREYSEDREAAVATFLNTLTAATDIAITAGGGTTGQTASAEIEAAIAALQFVRGGMTFDAFAMHVDLYKVLAAAKDTALRPLYPILGPTNANGTAKGRFRTLDIAGVLGVPAWGLGATGTAPANSWLFRPDVIHGWASAPQRINIEYQVKSVEIGIFGYIALGNTDISGVRQVIYDPVP